MTMQKYLKSDAKFYRTCHIGSNFKEKCISHHRTHDRLFSSTCCQTICDANITLSPTNPNIVIYSMYNIYQVSMTSTRYIIFLSKYINLNQHRRPTVLSQVTVNLMPKWARCCTKHTSVRPIVTYAKTPFS